MKKVLIALLAFTCLKTTVFAQVPVIQNVNPLTTYSNDTLVITGSGFSATAANLDVWFGDVKGTIITSSDFAIEVKVPAEARLTNIEVVNKTSQLSGKSELKFTSSLKTEAFDVTKFAAPLSFTAQQELWDMCLCDLNTDGKPDIATTKFARPSSPYLAALDIMILQNNSVPGTLAFNKLDKNNLPVLNLTFASDNIMCGDLNGDGKPELVVSRGSDPRNSIHIFRNTSTAAINFAAPVSLFLDINHAATRIVIRDLNKDGKPELIVTASTTDFFYIFVNQSSGGTLTFNPTPIKVDIDPATNTLLTYEPEVQDFNGDGLPDIIINRFQENDFFIFKNQSAGSISFAAPVKLATPIDRKFNRIASADFNKDGKLDLVFTNSSLTPVSAIYLNESTGGNISFSSDANAIKLTTSNGAWGIDVSDVDGDKDPDIFIASRDNKELNVFLHDGNFSSPGFGSKLIIPTTGAINYNTRNIKVGDLDGDAKPDIVYTGFSDAIGTTSVEILRNTHCHQPEIQNTEPLTICNGQTIILKTIHANNVTYAWLKDGAPVGTNSPYLTITSGGTYRVTATNGTCSLFDEIVVTTNVAATPPDPSITANSPLCVGSTLNLGTTAVAGATYTWTKPDGTTLATQNPSFVVSLDDAGIYELQIAIGVCKSDVATKRVDVANLASFAIASNPATNTVCQGGTVQLSVSNLANHTYQWKKDGADISPGGTTSSFTASLNGAYTVRVTNTILTCDTETTPANVIILQPPVAAFTVKATACTGEQLSFTNQSTSDLRGSAVFTWNFGDGNSVVANSPSKAYATAQTFNPSLTVTYAGISGCSNIISKPIAVVAGQQPVIQASAESLCPGDEVTLSVSGTFTTITWSTSTTGNSAIVSVADTYTVTTTDNNGCPGQDDIILTEKLLPTLAVSAEPAVIRSGVTSQLLASGADTYTWLPLETLDNSSIPNPIASPTQTTTTYTVTGVVTDGCSATADVTVTVQGTLGFPAIFSPNGDGMNDEWNIHAQDKPDCTLSVFDTRGRRIFENKGQNWAGTYEGKTVPNGTYYYVFGCPAEKPVTGNVLVIK